MLKFYNYDIVFQEIPDEITLAINLTMCPIHCKGCHSKFLWEDVGEVLDEGSLKCLINLYNKEITCVAFMGGDNDVESVNKLAKFGKDLGVKTAWYSGREEISNKIDRENFDYIKVGPYVEELGGLKSEKTNQRLYRVIGGNLEDITNRLRKR